MKDSCSFLLAYASTDETVKTEFSFIFFYHSLKIFTYLNVFLEGAVPRTVTDVVF